MSTPTKVEFAVKMTCQSCVAAVKNSLRDIDGVQGVDVDLQNERVVVTSTLPTAKVQSLLESSGRSVLVRGQGPVATAASVGAQHLGAAVAIMLGRSGVTGLARFTQVEDDKCILEGTVDGLSPGKHGIHIHEYGDISQGCESVGDHFNPYQRPHGPPEAEDRHVGDLGNVEADASGRAIFRLEEKVVKVWDVIGRTIVVDGVEDDYSPAYKSTVRVACGIIARSAGLFENDKKVCACTGRTMWQEKEDLSAPAPQSAPMTSSL
ncbi:copper chaperone for superoxide dismutase-like [Sycon ciliatum]|uniref:copper chaperone for superoxide dismutase-like n=1 Tax=Sycon ciliatum TaxID=27933 RepID=UPI0020AAAA19|eukprot:scpid30111/ scgid27987/ Copper chaperone for superoxide dismutase; Superoxide dismutase copper chaperone